MNKTNINENNYYNIHTILKWNDIKDINDLYKSNLDRNKTKESYDFISQLSKHPTEDKIFSLMRTKTYSNKNVSNHEIKLIERYIESNDLKYNKTDNKKFNKLYNFFRKERDRYQKKSFFHQSI